MKKTLRLSLLILLLPGAQSFAEPSMAIRNSKSFLVESHLGFNGFGAGMGYFLPNDSRLDLSFSKNDVLQFVDRSTVIKLEYQSFVANSFYYALGLNYRDIKTSNYYYNPLTPSYPKADVRIEIEAVHAHFSIGNEWSFEQFFIGAEWFGFSTPLSWSYTSKSPDTASELDHELWHKDTERDAHRSVLIAPNLYVGFAF